MNSKILVVVLLAYFLDNLSVALFKPVTSASLKGKNTFKQPIKSHHYVSDNFKVNPKVSYKVLTPPSPPKPPTPPAFTSLPSIKPLPSLTVFAPTSKPKNKNDNQQRFDEVEEGDDDYVEEEEGDEESLENSNTVETPTQSKPTTFTTVNNNPNKFQRSQSALSFSTSKPIVPENVKQKNGNQQGFKTFEGDEDEEVEEVIEDEDYEESLENSNTVEALTQSKPTTFTTANNNPNKFQRSQSALSFSTSKPIVPENVKQKNGNQQGFKTFEGDEDEEVEEVIEDEDYEESLENSNTVEALTQSKPTTFTTANNNPNKFQRSQSALSFSTSKPIVPENVKQKNGNQQGFKTFEGDDYEEVEEEIEDEDYEESLENSNTVETPTQSKPTTFTTVNNNPNKFQRSQSALSFSTSKPIVPENVKQKNGNQQGFKTFEGDEYEEGDEDEEVIEDEDYEESLENSNTVETPTQSKPTTFTTVNNNPNKFQRSQSALSFSTSKPIVPENVKQKNGNQQGFKTFEGDEDEEVEEEIEDEDYEESLENSKTVTSQPMNPVSENLNQAYGHHQGFETLEGDDYKEVLEETEDGHNVEEYSEDQNHKTPIIMGVQKNLFVPKNNLISSVPQLTGDEFSENNYDESKYSFNTDENYPAFQNDYEWELDSSNYYNNPTEMFETLDRKNDNPKDQSTNTNEFESNPYSNTQISTDKQEGNAEYQFKNQYVSENKERIINGYKAMKKILYMLHDYASATFNWIINKINYQMEHVSS